MNDRRRTRVRPAPLDRLPSRDAEGNYRAVIEASAGSRNKYKFDPSIQALVLHHVLPIGTSFPYSFGFIPSTLGEDGDPVDVLVLMDESAVPQTIVPCRLVGIIEAEQTQDGKSFRNDRLLAVATGSHRYCHCTALADLAPEVLTEVELFFTFYNRQRGRQFRVLARRGRRAAQSMVERAGVK
jgi:inorganic pyrophosphatase